MKILPSLRRHAVIFLLKKGKTQREIAKELSISEAAVSQYLSKRRASSDDKTLNRILAKEITTYDLRKVFAENVCDICKNLRKSKELCKLHMRDAKKSKKKIEKATCKICMRCG
jgi:predicted transcriptional regulator